jgi:hypothetical protein
VLEALHETDHSAPSDAVVYDECVELYLHSPMCLCAAVLNYRDNFALSFKINKCKP